MEKKGRKTYLRDPSVPVPKRSLYRIRHSTPNLHESSDEETVEECDVTFADSDADESPISDDSSETDELDESVLYFEQNDSHSKEPSEESPLYEGAPAELTEKMAHLLLFQYSVRHSLSEKALDDLLLLLSVFLPQNARIPKSTHKLKNYFVKSSLTAQNYAQEYCDTCHRLYTAEDHCDCNASRSQFVSVPLGPQLKSKLEYPNTWNVISWESTTASGITDIQDGQRHRMFTATKPHSKMLTLVVNTDGMQLFKSSSVAMWPIWVVINELPTRMRFSKNNMILAGLWCSKEKPTMNQFLKPLIESLNHLYDEGIEVSTPEGVIVTVRAAMLTFSCDLPARCLVLNMRQFNGAYSCHLCLDSGKNSPENPMVRWWPYHDTEKRSQESMLQDCLIATENKAPCRGMKGASVLALHCPFNICQGVVIDSLHCLYLGVTLKMLRLWFGKSNRTKDFSIRTKIDLCDRRLLRIKVPDRISRTPQSLAHFERWKGSELKWWVLFYSLPVLNGVFSDERYFKHWCLFVASVHSLESDNIQQQTLDKVERWLTDFYKEFMELYGERNCTMNMHLLGHLAACVRDWGPLWAYTCFTFESANNKLRKLFHGTKDMSKQMAFTYVLKQTLSAASNSPPSTPVGHLCNILFGHKSYAKQFLSNNNWALGGIHLRPLSPEESQSLYSYYLDNIESIFTFKRLERHGHMLFCREYSRVSKRNSFTIEYGPGKFGQIYYFTLHKGKAAAVIQQLVVLPSPTSFAPATTILPAKLSNTFEIIDIDTIVEKVVFVKTSESVSYISKFPSALNFD